MKAFLAAGEKFFTPLTLFAFNILVIVVVELTGDGQYFAQTGFIHLLALLFVGFVLVQIFTEYAFGDYLLKGFLRIQLAFFMFLAMIHIYEYFAEQVFMMRGDVAGLTVIAGYFVWLFSTFIALRFVLRVYYKENLTLSIILSGIVALCFLGLVAPNAFPVVVSWFPAWFPDLILLGIVTVAVLGIYYVQRIKKIMPIFRDYSRYMTIASVLMVVTAFSEYFEGINFLESFGISHTQNLYFSHFVLFAALSLLLIGYNKLKKPTGIYADM